jgi:hypothetical protein
VTTLAMFSVLSMPLWAVGAVFLMYLSALREQQARDARAGSSSATSTARRANAPALGGPEVCGSCGGQFKLGHRCPDGVGAADDGSGGE